MKRPVSPAAMSNPRSSGSTESGSGSCRLSCGLSLFRCPFPDTTRAPLGGDCPRGGLVAWKGAVKARTSTGEPLLLRDGMPRHGQVTRQWHWLPRYSAARPGRTLAQVVDAIPLQHPANEEAESSLHRDPGCHSQHLRWALSPAGSGAEPLPPPVVPNRRTPRHHTRVLSSASLS